MNNKLTAHIISHTHWDREWYLNSKYTNKWLIPFFENLFAMFEKEEDYIFVLDGQLLMVEDYFEELDKLGYNINEYKRKIKKYVSQKRLFLGPYYLQPDWQLVSDESLVRNMLIGNHLAMELGGSMNIGWLLDNFGQISQAPQLHSEAGLKGIFVWRGVEMDTSDIRSEFLWESPDGTKITAIYLLDSYRNMMRLAEYSDIMHQRIYDELDKLKPFLSTSHVVLMNGYDQEMIPDDILPYIRNGGLDSDVMQVIQSNPEKYIEAVMSEEPQLKTLHGALYSGRFISVFPGVMSTRVYLKQQNDEQQKYLEKIVEPLSSIIWLQGGEYENTQIREAWKMLLKNHPHDSICGVSIDDVHLDMEERFRTVNRLSISLIEQKLKELAGLINTSDCNDQEVKVIFNPSFYKRDETVEFENNIYYISDIPALGYKVIEKSDIYKPLKVKENTVENKYFLFKLNENGSYSIKYKETGKEYKNLGIIEDRADTGDEYNYSYPNKDKIFSTEELKAQITIDKKLPWFIRYKVELVMSLPESDANNHAQRSEILRKLPLINYITIESNSPLIKCKTLLRNTVKDHIMRVLFPTNINADFAYAGSPFDITKRPIFIKDYDETSIQENVKKIMIGARGTKPNTIFLNREVVDINNGNEGLAILSKGLLEYQVIDKDNKIALTLFRSVGWIAKKINSRIGDAGPEIFTPDAQCLREMTFEYAIYPHIGDVEKGKVCRKADIYNTPLVNFTTDRHTGSLDKTRSYFEINDTLKSIKMTAVKRGENGKKIIIRGYNSSSRETELNILSLLKIKSAWLTDLIEKEKNELMIKDNRIILKINGKKIFTIALEIEIEKLEITDKVEMILERKKDRSDFSKYEYAPHVTLEDIESEKARSEELKIKIEDPMWRRTALEAQLSTILTQHKYDEKIITNLGYELNEARIQRRTYDYIQHYKKPQRK